MASFVKPITIQANSPEEATKVAEALKKMLQHFTSSEVIKVGALVESPVKRLMFKGYLK